MRANGVRQRLQAGQPTVGALLGLGSPSVAELMALSGYDWLVVEMEHNAVDVAQAEHMLMAMNGTDVIPLIRPPSGDPLVIQKALDIGAMGVFVPMVRTAEEAAAIVRATRYPPAGVRGFGPLRASQYTLDYADYFRDANDNMLLVLIVETKEAVENLEAIMDVPGVDVLFFGLFDLCISLGLNPMEMPFPEVDDIMQKALELGRTKGVAIGAGTTTPEELRQRVGDGYTFVSYGTDYLLLRDAVRSGLDAFRAIPDARES